MKGIVKVRAQSEEQKFIKRINEQLADISRISNISEQNPLVAAWSRAIRESGLEFTKDKGTARYRIKNTAENREKAVNLMRTMDKYKPQTAGEYRKKIREELAAEAKKKLAAEVERRKAAGERRLTRAERRAFIAGQTSKKAVSERIRVKNIDRKIQYMLDVIYNQTGNYSIGEELSKLTKGTPLNMRDNGQIYDIFGKISAEFRRIQEGALTEEEILRAKEARDLEDDFK